MDGSVLPVAIVFVLSWVLQGLLTYWQTRRLRARIEKLKMLGRVGIGVSGKTSRVYGLLAVYIDNLIVGAEKLTGWTIFAVPQPVDLLVGRSLHDQRSDCDIEGLSPGLRSAFVGAAESLMKRKIQADITDGVDTEKQDTRAAGQCQ